MASVVGMELNMKSQKHTFFQFLPIVVLLLSQLLSRQLNHLLSQLLNKLLSQQLNHLHNELVLVTYLYGVMAFEQAWPGGDWSNSNSALNSNWIRI
jgi:hypothetical protein